MAQRKTAEADTRTQRQKFIDAARTHGADEGDDAFKRVVRAMAKTSPQKPKKGTRKRKGT
jgi:hypothetical protein